MFVLTKLNKKIKVKNTKTMETHEFYNLKNAFLFIGGKNEKIIRN